MSLYTKIQTLILQEIEEGLQPEEAHLDLIKALAIQSLGKAAAESWDYNVKNEQPPSKKDAKNAIKESTELLTVAVNHYQEAITQQWDEDQAETHKLLITTQNQWDRFKAMTNHAEQMEEESFTFDEQIIPLEVAQHAIKHVPKGFQ